MVMSGTVQKLSIACFIQESFQKSQAPLDLKDEKHGTNNASDCHLSQEVQLRTSGGQ